ncbi:hypothetical protein HKCCE3408_09520 [Rhodobacterales bacterium HKCCE3408]|nr:hypothetical protein [Rhodobacterales bacterium HKCCE3408]
MEVLDILPRDRPFTSLRIAELTPLHLSQMTGRINHLIKEGYVVRLENGVFCVKGCEEEASKHLAPRVAKMVQFKGFGTHKPVIRKPGETQEAILDAMRDGANTIREIGWELEAEYNTVKCALDRLIARGLVTRDTEGYYRLAPQSAVVAANG